MPPRPWKPRRPEAEVATINRGDVESWLLSRPVAAFVVVTSSGGYTPPTSTPSLQRSSRCCRGTGVNAGEGDADTLPASTIDRHLIAEVDHLFPPKKEN
jgi:hypothetical protein